MDYTTKTYKFSGPKALGDEIVHIAITNQLRVSKRLQSGILRKKDHFLEIFGPADNITRFEAQMENAKNRIK